ncbi:MAG: LEPR-XLL domain-containing protein, partial [Roseimicrobium sp.]
MRLRGEYVGAYLLEVLEPRILLSAGPVDAMVPVPDAPQSGQETPAGEQYQQAEMALWEAPQADQNATQTAAESDYMFGETQPLDDASEPV